MMSWDRRRIFKTSLATLFWVAFLALFVPFYTELLLAGVFAFAMEPALGRLFKGRFLHWRPFVALILFSSFVVLAVPVTVVSYKLYAYVVEISRTGVQNTPAFEQLVMIKGEIVRLTNQFLSKVGLSEQFDLPTLLDEHLSRGGNFAVGVLAGSASQVPQFLLSLFVFIAALYFFLAEGEPLKRIFLRQRVLNEWESERLIRVLQKSSFNTVVSSMVIAVMQATTIAIGAWSLGAGDFMIVWVVTFFCSFVPVIGAGPVAGVLALGQVVMGNWGKAIGLLVVAIVGGTLDNVARPYILSSGEEDLHPVVSLLAIIGALILFGMPGLFLGPVIASVAIKIIATLSDVPQPAITASGKDPVKKDS